VIIKHIQIANFCQFTEVDMDVPCGLIGITGPNGSGKSNFMGAIAWALYGIQQSGKDVKSALRKRGSTSKQPVSVSITFSIDGIDYTVLREMKGTNDTITASIITGGVEIAHGVDAVGKSMASILGMGYKPFMVSMFCKQKEIDALSSLQPAQRREIIMSMLGVNRVDKAITETRSKSRSIDQRVGEHQPYIVSDVSSMKDELSDLNTQLTNNQTLIDECNQVVSDLKNKIDLFPSQPQFIDDIKVELAREQGECHAWMRVRDDIMNEISGLASRQHVIYEQIQGINALGPNGVCPTCFGTMGEQYNKTSVDLSEKYSVLDLNINRRRADWESANTNVNTHNDAADGITARINAMMSEHANRYRQVSAEYNNAMGVQSALRQDISRIENRIVIISSTISQYDSHKNTVDALLCDKHKLTQLERLLTGFRSEVTSRILPLLGYYASQYTTHLTDGKYNQVVVDDNYNIQIYSGDGLHPLSTFSGGEIDVFNMSLRLAISRVLSEYSGRGIHSMFMDEILSTLDRERRQLMISLFRSPLCAVDQVFIISHVDDIHDQMDYVYTVSDTGSTSTVRMVSYGDGT